MTTAHHPTYESFLDRKSQLGQCSGFEPIGIPDFLFDFQKSLVDWAIRKGRAAIFADCGLGNGTSTESLIFEPNVESATASE